MVKPVERGLLSDNAVGLGAALVVSVALIELAPVGRTRLTMT